MELKFCKCKHCGNVATKITDKGVKLYCCGEEMKELVAGTTDGAKEKHVPVYEVNGSEVSVVIGEVIHPMIEAHYIEWIGVETTKGFYFKKLNPNDEPKAVFNLTSDEKLVTVFEYCNLHGLWKA